LKIDLNDPDLMSSDADMTLDTPAATIDKTMHKVKKQRNKRETLKTRKTLKDMDSKSFMNTPIKRRRPVMAVHLALTESDPFQKLIKEGVPVVIHYLLPNERRVRRIRRVMILEESPNIDEYGEDLPFHKRTLPKLKFSKPENSILLQTNDYIYIHNVYEIICGVYTNVFKSSMTHLYGTDSSVDRTNNEKRCFSLIGAISPFDGRLCMDIEIDPRDKQKSEVI
jgi:hypothetical protein